jgi:Asp/Glu/hydantoin racemase
LKKVYIIQTSLVSQVELNALFAEIVPEAQVFNIVDDSLLHDLSKIGGIDDKIVARMCAYIQAAAANGADLIFNQCSSVGEAADIAAKMINVPVLKVDAAMAEKAVELGTKIAVATTARSTMGPTGRLIRSKAAAVGKNVEVCEYLVDGALEILMKEKNREKHNALVMEAVKRAETQCDVIVFAQGSMTVLLPELKDIKKPVLTSPRLGVERARKILMGK